MFHLPCARAINQSCPLRQVSVVEEATDITVTLARHDRTDTAIDTGTGRARAAIALTYFTEQN